MNNAYSQKTKDALRAAGVRQPFCGTGWFGIHAGLYPELYSNVPGMDYIDRHHYYGGGPGGWQLLPGQPFRHEAALTEPKHILQLGMERVLDMPFGISEWANVLPNQWRLAEGIILGGHEETASRGGRCNSTTHECDML